MQNLVNDSVKKKNFAFVDSIRAIAMMSIVMEHCVFFDRQMYHPPNTASLLIFCTFIQFIKFGTISFFLLSGFLIGEKFTDYTPVQYLKRRLDSTFLPWLFWSLIFLATMLLDDLVKAIKFDPGHFFKNVSEHLPMHLESIYLYSNYWFIPNFLICISILLVFKRYLYSKILGGIFLLLTLIYTVNIYYEWIEPRHSTAILGFVFFLWLGAQFNRHLAQFEKWLNRTSIWVFITIAIISLILGVKEEVLLIKRHSTDPFNSLRLSSIVYALSFFMILMKIKNYKFTKYLKPRETTYGIYLIHFILVAQLLPLLFPTLKHSVDSLSTPMLIIYQLSRFVIVYALTVGLIFLINRSKFRWSIGQ
ncbi:acyltransferase [Mucilaginibacter sp. KACC 22063]|uniref:acyltransferase n=1 Tax=Mucilaginibacter sp. KACC 22063 TaxID=3025666 RepID=UPI0023659EDC|nr:acyltransferase [Mucilaginibacter sp. KACC 22063]WDF55165.1 acyltransferase [Mucilaginibacter sp. KACC 22063]